MSNQKRPLMVDNDILNKKVSYQMNTWSSISADVTIREVLSDIKSSKHKPQVLALRNLILNGKRQGYDVHKKTLPAVTFCGTFNEDRKKSNLKNYNSLIVLDVDKVNLNELKRIKGCFQNDSIVFSYWESPSQEGVKGLVPLKYNFEITTDNIDIAHRSAFQKLSYYFNEKYNIQLDKSGNDTTRLCFFSHDRSLVLKEQTVCFEIDINDLEAIPNITGNKKSIKISYVSNRDALFNPKDRNKPGDRYTIQSIIKFLEKRNLSITNSYETWFKVAMAIANSFTYEIGEKYFLRLSAIDREKFSELDCKNFLNNCYNSRTGAIKFDYIVHLATQKEYIIKKRKDRGTEAVD